MPSENQRLSKSRIILLLVFTALNTLMVFKAQLFSVMNGQDSSIENLIGDYAENESEKESKEAESKVSKTMEEQKWLRTFDLLNNSSLTFSKYISSASLKGLPSISLEIETPPPDITV